MRSFVCRNCDQLVFFENSMCLRCSTPLAFVPSGRELVALTGSAETVKTADVRRCANLGLAACNWAVEDQQRGPLCDSCTLTRTRPADGDLDGLAAFAKAEGAKRRLLFELLELRLPIDRAALRFDLLSSARGPVVTGHDNGLITIDLAESDDVQREQRRSELGEPYRTMLGPLPPRDRPLLRPDPDRRAARARPCRNLFGDEREDYSAALQRHYADGPPADWEERYVSAYATMHPWEDWAETFAHYLHIGTRSRPRARSGYALAALAQPAIPRSVRTRRPIQARERSPRSSTIGCR